MLSSLAVCVRAGRKNESKKFICPVNHFSALGVSGCGSAQKS